MTTDTMPVIMKIGIHNPATRKLSGDGTLGLLIQLG